MMNEKNFSILGIGTAVLLLAPIAIWLLAMGIGGICSGCCELCGYLF